MRLIKYPSKEQWTELLKRPALNTENLFDTVRSIINKVRAEGDKAVLKYEATFDKRSLCTARPTLSQIIPRFRQQTISFQLWHLLFWSVRRKPRVYQY